MEVGQGTDNKRLTTLALWLQVRLFTRCIDGAAQAQERRSPGAGPARLPCSAFKLLQLSHLWCKFCILRSAIPSSIIVLPALRTNLLYRDSPSAENAPDEENIFIRDEEPFGYHPKKGCYPDLYNHL